MGGIKIVNKLLVICEFFAHSRGTSRADLIAALRTCDRRYVAASIRLPLRACFLLMLASTQKIFRECNEALHIALQFPAILQRLFHLINKISGAQIKTSPGAITEADQLLMRDIWQRHNAVVQAILG